MQVVVLRERCPDRVSCPHLYCTDRGTYVVQGYVNAELSREPGQAVVEIPLALIPEIAAHSHADLYLTDHGTVLVRGAKVTDPEALARMQLPDDEDAVELVAEVLPALDLTLDVVASA